MKDEPDGQPVRRGVTFFASFILPPSSFHLLPRSPTAYRMTPFVVAPCVASPTRLHEFAIERSVRPVGLSAGHAGHVNRSRRAVCDLEVRLPLRRLSHVEDRLAGSGPRPVVVGDRPLVQRPAGARVAAAVRLWQASRLPPATRAVLPGDHDRHFFRLAVGPLEHAHARVLDDGGPLRDQRLDHLLDAETDRRRAGRSGAGDGGGADHHRADADQPQVAHELLADVGPRHDSERRRTPRTERPVRPRAGRGTPFGAVPGAAHAAGPVPARSGPTDGPVPAGNRRARD